MAAMTTMSSPTVNVIFNQPSDHLRFIEASTEGSHLESLFLLCDHARDSHFRQLKESIPEISDYHSVVRSMHVKLDHHWPHNFPQRPDRNPFRTRPHAGQLYRAESRITHIGTKSVRLQHRYFTVPQSQIQRDFNDRSQDAFYTQLAPDEEPGRLFASAEGAVVFIQWQQDSVTGRQFYKPTSGPYHDSSLVVPSVIDFVGGSGPGRRTADQPRPDNAFRVPFLLRQSDKDSLGHVTNSRYASIIHDVFLYGLQQGYYANGSGEARTGRALPVLSVGPHGSEEKATNTGLQQQQGGVAVPAGAQFYKRAKVHELYVGYEDELKVKPGVVVWSWVEPERLQGVFDVVHFEICATDEATGVEKVVSQCRVVFLEDGAQKASL